MGEASEATSLCVATKRILGLPNRMSRAFGAMQQDKFVTKESG
jgi:hypothetical protein